MRAQIFIASFCMCLATCFGQKADEDGALSMILSKMEALTETVSNIKHEVADIKVSGAKQGRRKLASAPSLAGYSGVRVQREKASVKLYDTSLYRASPKTLGIDGSLKTSGSVQIGSVGSSKDKTCTDAGTFRLNGDKVQVCLKNKWLGVSTESDCLITPGIKAFTSSGTFTVPKCVKNVRVLVVAGGGGGGGRGGGGGGAGGLIYKENYPVTAGASIKVTIGNGGGGGCGAGGGCGPGKNGANSVFGTLTAIGGGGGGGDGGHVTGKSIGGNGGSGGGGYETSCNGDCPGGKGVPGQGNDGGTGTKGPIHDSGGGGGAGETGGHSKTRGDGHGGDGGDGKCFSEFASYGASGCFAGGGGGAVHNPCKSGGSGGKGGGGNAGACCGKNGFAAKANTGGGGGGGSTCGGGGGAGASGGSGIVIVKW